MPLDIRLHEGRIEIEPVALKVKLERRGRLVVAVPREAIPPLSAAVVEETRRKARRDRRSNG